MSKYRFKTKEEFIRDGLWDDEYDTPEEWSPGREMNEYLGREIPEFYLEECEAGGTFRLDGWAFCSNDYVEINDSGFEYFGDTLMEVSENNESWFPRVVFGKKGGYYLAWCHAETLEEAKNAYSSTDWNYARPIKTKLTLKQVAEKFGLKEDEIEIVES